MCSKYLDELYDSTFESVYEALVEMVRKDPRWALQQIRGILKSLYVRQGNDWSGRGVVSDTGIDASIAAHESILADLASRPDLDS
ncbi:hypothetical protein GMLC_21920 [Geomonas limicola]|uniref:Uncharacterized protein n=1 Tax=Geomonas limicola TaxID=2740186 RepID=A0A6V8NAP2_9BACT|nr:hypothetical protein [Geomonas limicola]GFO68613.1 hypothetical protein GMLC_21920 [Geomonas limicola]